METQNPEEQTPDNPASPVEPSLSDTPPAEPAPPPVVKAKPRPIPVPADDNTFVAGRQPPPRPRPAPPPPAAADDADDRAPSPLAAFFSENLLLKAGIAILFLGLAFLLRYASTRVHISIPLRYCAVAATAAVLAAAGWHLRTKRRDYALAIQGAALAIMFGGMMPGVAGHAWYGFIIVPAAAFAMTIGACGLIYLIAVLRSATPAILVLGGIAVLFFF